MAGKSLKLLSVVSFLYYLLCPSLTNAVLLPPSFVYRSDFREPANIFKNGMPSQGSNQNLLDHIYGNSCMGGTKNTAFVATSLQKVFANHFGWDLLWTTENAGPYIYLYKIRASDNFFEVKNSLQKAFKSSGDEDYKDALDTFGHEHEWVALGGIPANQIKTVYIYTKGDKMRTGKLVGKEKNPHYVDKATRGNRAALPVQGKTNGATLVTSSSPQPISACFISCVTKKVGRFVSADSAGGTSCKTKGSVFHTSLETHKGSFWDPVKHQHVEGFLPWKEVNSDEGGHVIEKPEDCAINTDDNLTILCPKNKYYERFRVYLKGRIGRTVLFHTKHKEGVTGRTWRKSARHIEMLDGGGSLENEGYSMRDVFAGTNGNWKSETRIYPLYPIMNT